MYISMRPCDTMAAGRDKNWRKKTGFTADASVGVVFAFATCLKLLLIPSYHSTDFEVHRNWLAITHSLPLTKWYYEDTSKWTLDYPPLFAVFEWILSWPAALADPKIVELKNLEYAAPSCVIFQRLSVIVSDLVLFYAILQYCQWKSFKGPLNSCAVAMLVLLNSGLLLVDHIHFQYNGFLYGILLLSILKVLQKRYVQAAVWFSLLLNLKHIYIYVAPVYFIFLLKQHCFSQNMGKAGHFILVNFVQLASVVLVVFGISFGPYIYHGQLLQVLSRLFPFQRGLCHAYWAPNFWALYSAVDKAFAFLGPSVKRHNGSMTSGIVGEMEFQVVPSITPFVTLILTILVLSPVMYRLWLQKKSGGLDFLYSLILCGYCTFIFGWHVHEKAIMMITIPMCLLAVEDKRSWKIFIVLSTVAHISLFPLLYRAAETLIKVCMLVFYLILALTSSTLLSRNCKSTHLHWELNKAEMAYLCGSILVQIYCLFIHGTGGLMCHLQFLPLLLTSVTCAIGVIWTWFLTVDSWMYS